MTDKTGKSEKLLDAVDASIKRLVTPTTFLVAAAVLGNGLQNIEGSAAFSIFVIATLVVISGLYFLFSVGVFIHKMEEAGVKKGWVFLTAIPYLWAYIVVFLVALRFGLENAAKIITSQ